MRLVLLRPHGAISAFFLLTLLLIAGFNTALAINCPTSKLPKPTEDFAVTKAQLEADGLWQQNRSVPEDPQLGDTWDWYIWDLTGMPVANLKPCTIRGMGDNVFVVVDDDEWNVAGMDQDAVDRIVDHFDNQSVGNFPDQGIWDLNTSHFGDPPNNLDGQERIFLLYYRFNIAADGFFWVFDQYPDGSQQWASNEADVIYMATDNGEPDGNYMMAVMAHEFEHLIHFNTDQNEESWVDEGLAELAMWLFGNPDTISGFNTNTDNRLTNWTGAWADYIKTYLWTLYMYEKYGGQSLIYDVCHNPLNSMEGYRTSLENLGGAPDMGNIFGDWCMANYLHDSSIGDGRYGYEGETLPLFWAWRIHSSSPASGSGTISGWAGESMRLLNLDEPLAISFDGIDSREFRLFVTSKEPGLPTIVDPVVIGDRNEAMFQHHEGYSEAVLTVANVNSNISASYTYSTEFGLSPVPVADFNKVDLHCHPNPFNPQTELSFRLAEDTQGRVLIHDSRGHLVQVLHDGPLGMGDHRFAWNAHGLASGVYFSSLEIDGVISSVRKLTLVQ